MNQALINRLRALEARDNKGTSIQIIEAEGWEPDAVAAEVERIEQVEKKRGYAPLIIIFD